MFSRFSLRHWFGLVALCTPIFFVSTRDVVLHLISITRGVREVSANAIGERSCISSLCSRSSDFNLSKDLLKRFHRPAVAYYGAQLDSFVSWNGNAVDPISRVQDIRVTWPKFRSWQIPRDSIKGLGVAFSVTSVSPGISRKIGLESGAVLVGDERDLSLMQFVFSLYNIHIYVFLALLTLAVGFILMFGINVESGVEPLEVGKGCLVVALATLFYSTIFDDIFLAVGTPLPVVQNLAQMLWAPAVLMMALDAGRLRSIAISFWMARIVAASVEWPLRELIFYGTYRWSFLAIVVIVAAVAFSENKKHYLLPFLAFAIWDSLAMFSLVRVLNGIYLTPLSLFGLFACKYINPLASIFEHHKFWYERRTLEANLQELRNSSSIDKAQWKSFLSDVCRLLSLSTGGSTVGLCYLGLDSPLVLSWRRGEVRVFEDGQLPPIFARTIQTREAQWWTSASDLLSILPTSASQRRERYTGTLVSLLPILVGEEIYGAISITDLSHELEQTIRTSEDYRHQVETTVTSFLDLISGRLVKRKESTANLITKQSNTITQNFSKSATLAISAEEAVLGFLKILVAEVPCGAMYFSLQSETGRLHLLKSVNLSEEIEKEWRDIPFRARSENKTSPFAITINERRSVYIENISSFFNLLTPLSVDVISHSQTNGFASVPVSLGEKVLGLICLLDLSPAHRLSAEITSILEVPTKYLAYQIEQHRLRLEIKNQEATLYRFIDPKLVEIVVNAGGELNRAIGTVDPTVIIVQDLRGSRQAGMAFSDPEELANRLNLVYERASSIAFAFDASYDKSNGDGSIVTKVVSETSNGDGLKLALQLLDGVRGEAFNALGIERVIVCVHRGKPFRGVLGATRRLALDVCGADINDTFTMEQEAKKMPGIVLAVSHQIFALESQAVREAMVGLATNTQKIRNLSGDVFLFDELSAKALLAITSGLDKKIVA